MLSGTNFLRVRVICVIIGLLIFGNYTVFSDSIEKSYKIGLSVWTGYPENIKGFKEALHKAGLVEGKNVKYLYRKSSGDKEKQRDIAQEFKEKKVDLVYTLTTPGTIIIKEIMPESTPIVFSIVTYPADSGLIESFDYSANNLVGTSNYVSIKSYTKLLMQCLPNVKTVAIFHRYKEPNSKIQAVNFMRSLRKKGIKCIDLLPKNLDEVKEMAMQNIEKVDALITTTDTLMQGGGEEVLIELSLKHKVPILSSNKQGIEKGSTFGPVADFYTLGKISGSKAVKVLVDKVAPSKMRSELQDPPLYLINKSSVKTLGLKLAPIDHVRYIK